MVYHRLKRSGLSVSRIALGCWAFAGTSNWGPQDDENSIAAVHAALDLGITLFDTAEGYGDGYSEQVLGRALRGRRQDAVIATKPKPDRATRDEVQTACEESLKRLGSDYIDLYQLHWPSRKVPFSETVEGLERLKEAGKIRAYGVCNFGNQDLAEMLELAEPETNQLAYSLLWRGIEYQTLPQCVAHSVDVLPYSPLAQGLLTGKYRSADEVPVGRARTKHFSGERDEARHQRVGEEPMTFSTIDRIREISTNSGLPMAQLAVGWLLAQRGVASVLVGGRDAEQVRENAAAGDAGIPADVAAELTAASDTLKQRLGDETDPWADRMR
jgi:aryl-alcohol dehydrogenase-like predicted oxidoreductase